MLQVECQLRILNFPVANTVRYTARCVFHQLTELIIAPHFDGSIKSTATKAKFMDTPEDTRGTAGRSKRTAAISEDTTTRTRPNPEDATRTKIRF